MTTITTTTTTTTTTALVLSGINAPFRLETITLGTLRPAEALAEIHASGGIVKQVGSQVKHVVPGDKVLLSFSHCQVCAQCMDGHPAYCYSFLPLNLGGKRLDGSSVMRRRNGQGETAM
ncbi:hypothetical protein E4U41_006593 [Claviceps citrina]|nr:hypothetical protein E4U41_006593 [Claviceps citrina]